MYVVIRGESETYHSKKWVGLVDVNPTDNEPNMCMHQDIIHFVMFCSFN